MAGWKEVASAAPGFAERVQSLFDAHRHKAIATLRKDGSPRISGIEVAFEGGEAWVGMMPGSLKARDLQRDPRFALHSASVDPDDADPSAWPGDAKMSGRAVEVAQPPGEASHRFRLDLAEVVLTRVGDPADHLVIESWHEGRGYETRKRT